MEDKLVICNNYNKCILECKHKTPHNISPTCRVVCDSYPFSKCIPYKKVTKEDIENKIVMCKYGDTCNHLVDDKPCKHNKPHKSSIDCANTTCERGKCVAWNVVGEKEERKMSIYEEIGLNIGTLVTKKQKAYGDSFSKSAEFLKLLYPDGIKPDQYLDILTLVRIYDKIQRIATDKDAFGESPYSDIIGYGILGKAKDKKNESK